jgi:hypothetical protein
MNERYQEHPMKQQQSKIVRDHFEEETGSKGSKTKIHYRQEAVYAVKVPQRVIDQQRGDEKENWKTKAA